MLLKCNVLFRFQAWHNFLSSWNNVQCTSYVHVLLSIRGIVYSISYISSTCSLSMFWFIVCNSAPLRFPYCMHATVIIYVQCNYNSHIQTIQLFRQVANGKVISNPIDEGALNCEKIKDLCSNTCKVYKQHQIKHWLVIAFFHLYVVHLYVVFPPIEINYL